MISKELLGILLAIMAALCWSITPALFSIILKGKRIRMGILGVNALRLFGTLPLALPVLMIAWRDGINQLGILLVFIGAILGPGLGDQLYLKAISLSGSAIATPLSHVYILFVQVLAIMLLGEPFKLTFFIASILVILGIWLIYSTLNRGRGSKSISNMVVALSLFTGLSWALATIVSKYTLMLISPSLMFSIRSLFLLVFMNALAYFSGEFKNIQHISKTELAIIILAGFIGLGLGILLYIYALYFVEASRVAVVSALTPVLNQFLSMKIAKERITSKTILGALLVSLGLLLVSAT